MNIDELIETPDICMCGNRVYMPVAYPHLCPICSKAEEDRISKTLKDEVDFLQKRFNELPPQKEEE